MLRYRQSPQIRVMLNEIVLTKSNLIYPIFINENLQEKKAVQKMPGVFQQSPSTLLAEVERIVKLGLNAVLLFGVPTEKDLSGSSSYHSEGVIQNSIAAIKKSFPHVVVIADCCLCEYTSNGSCGILENGKLDNDKTLQTLQKIALSYAQSGADIIAPSGMMDGMVQAIRRVLDGKGFEMTSIMSYAVKFASQFYGPFREAAGSATGQPIDRKHHMLAPGLKRESLREALLDVEEGADYLMIKPGLPCLDIIQDVRNKTLLPIVAYQVSGEYSMLKMGAAHGLFDEAETFNESLISLKRAGADLIVTYYADKIAERL
jgi:porphobilinogen synthase